MKRLVVCCDGTWNTAVQAAPTNVCVFHDAVAPAGDDGVQQVCHYVQGVGTKPWERLLGGVFGLGLSDNVKEAYHFLVDNFEPGDELFLVGFSRGAYTVRSAAGLVRKAGILRAEHRDRVDEAYDLYRTGERPSSAGPARFRAAYSHETRVRFVGVWDTVGALGIPVTGFAPSAWINRRWQFHDTDLSASVDGAFHAVAIDERRATFEPALWHKQADAGDQRVEQVWFSGVHSDVGGGYDERGLADVTLTWMADRAAELGLTLRDDALAPLRLRPRVDDEIHASRTGIYRLQKPLTRALGVTDPDTELAASSAVARQERDPSYAPNLRAYRAGRHFRESVVRPGDER